MSATGGPAVAAEDGPEEPALAADAPPAEWSDADDWTDEALALLRSLRTPHRLNRVRQVAYALYCTVLILVVWGGVPSLGLFLQAAMGADYTGGGPALLAAVPGGVAAAGYYL
ncbi:hypothetical protein ABZ641_31530, partial [Kitasatospora sp. NPDC007106]